MKGKIALALAVVAVAVMASGPVKAGCNPSKEFALAFYDLGNFDIYFPADADTAVNGAVIGHQWGPGARATTGDQSLGTCDDSMWLYPPSGAGSMTIYGSNGADFGAGLCDTTACPSGGLIVVVQTKSTDNSKAYYTVGRVVETFTAPGFDFARTGENWNAVEIPRPQVTGSSRTAVDVTVDVALAPPAAAFHAPVADALVATGTITGYQLVTASGAADPGREAALWTNAGGVIPTTAPTASGVVLACPTGTSIFLANRVIVDGFASDYVSGSTRISCSNLATPGTPGTKPKPITNKKSISKN